MEAGYSESKSKLEADAKWEPNGDVKTALMTNMHRGKPETVIHKWVSICTGQPNFANSPTASGCFNARW